MADQRRSALIVVSDSYKDEKLTQLQAPKIDAKRLSILLKKQRIGGGYNVKILPNKKSHTIRVEVERFFKDAEKNDLLLLYFAGHGYKASDDGKYYLVAQDSYLDLTATMIASSFINEQIAKSRASNKILILDCCYSGAFLNARADKTVDINQEFELDPGTAILTSSTAMQYSFEGNVPKQEGKSALVGIYTDLLIRGIESAEADTDGDGKIGCLELNAYIKKKMRELGHPQTPQVKIEKEDVTLAFTKVKTKDAIIPSRTVPLDPKREIDYLFKSANARMRERKYKAAIDSFDQILRIDPHNANALYGKARNLWFLRKVEESLKFFDETLVVVNDDPRVLFEKGLVLRSLGRHLDAYNIFKDLVYQSKLPPIFPGFLDKFIDRGNETVRAAKIHYRELETIVFNPKKALSVWKRKLKSENIYLSPWTNKEEAPKKAFLIDTVNNVSYLFRKLGNIKEALIYLEIALSWYPGDAYAQSIANSIIQTAERRCDILKREVTSSFSLTAASEIGAQKSLIDKVNKIIKKYQVKNNS